MIDVLISITLHFHPIYIFKNEIRSQKNIHCCGKVCKQDGGLDGGTYSQMSSTIHYS